MNVALRKSMSLADFLVWEERQELRYEFDGFRPVAMTGGTVGHDEITSNLRQALKARLAGTPCRPYGPNVKIIAAGRVRYPDVLVSCSPVANTATIIEQPVVVFEVVSHDNQRTDRIEKVHDYRATPTIQRYLILEQTFIGATVFVRQGEDWIATALAEGDTLSLPEIGIELPLDECYAGLDLPRDAGTDEKSTA
jgi:Uma2 family endonuclease